MKTLVKILIASVLFASATNAAQKLWTWKPSNESAHHMLRGIGMHDSGAAAFVVSEFDSPTGKITFLLVWIDKNGKRVMSRTVPFPVEKAEDTMDPYGVGSFSVSFIGADSIAVYPTENNGDDYKVRIYKSGSQQVALLDPYQTVLFGGGRFAGWVAKKTVMVPFKNSWSGEKDWFGDLQSISALKP